MKTSALATLALLFAASACTPAASGLAAANQGERPEAVVGETVDILAMSLDFNVATSAAVAIIEFPPRTESGAIRLEKGNLEILAVADPNGPLQWTVDLATDKRKLDIGTPAGTRQIRIDYKFDRFPESFDPKSGGALVTNTTRTWPDHCGNLFPCNSGPADGAQYRIALSGLTADQVGVFPRTIASDAPSYMPAWAVGKYVYKELGKTTAGTTVGTYATHENQYEMKRGTRGLLKSFEWFEETLGPYPFGDRVASVEVDWGSGSPGAMEHHPFWHISTGALRDAAVHIHEAAHGWFGNGVRIKCWEDLVLSEGVAGYLTGRALEKLSTYDGRRYWRRLPRNAEIVWPTGCNAKSASSILTDSLYANGALFFRTVEQKVGRSALEKGLASFYALKRGKAVRFADLLEHLKSETGVDFQSCANLWLRSLEARRPVCKFDQG